jgi:hypothetical protein
MEDKGIFIGKVYVLFLIFGFFVSFYSIRIFIQNYFFKNNRYFQRFIYDFMIFRSAGKIAASTLYYIIIL